MDASSRRSGLSLGAMLPFAGYTLLLLLLTWKHTFWRDETEVWLIARASGTVRELLHNIRYEGHPPLWYLVQWGLTRFTTNVEWMKLPNFLAAVAAAAMLLTARRLPLWARLGIVFSYYMVFEYGVIARNYMIGIVFLVAAARLMTRRARQSVAVPFLLSLAALTSLPALVVATGMGALYLWFVWRARGDSFLAALGGVRIAGILLYTVCALLAAATIRPPADSGLLLESKPPHLGLVTKVAVAGQIVTKAYVPIPLLQPKFWNTLLMDRIGFRPEALLGLLLIVALVLFFRGTPVRWFFLGASAIEVAQMLFSGRAMERHLGWLFVIFVLALLLDEPAEGAGWRRPLLAGVLACQVAAGGVAVAYSLKYPFSTSKQAAKFLVDNGMDRRALAFEPFFVGQSVLSYLPGTTGYSLEEHRTLPFVLWDRREFVTRRPAPGIDELREAGSAGAPALLITEKPLAPSDAARLQVKLLASFDDAVCPLDNYYIYDQAR